MIKAGRRGERGVGAGGKGGGGGSKRKIRRRTKGEKMPKLWKLTENEREFIGSESKLLNCKRYSRWVKMKLLRHKIARNVL